MDVNAVRWESLALVLAMWALAIWALTSASGVEAGAQSPAASVQALVLEVRRPGLNPEVVRAPDGAVFGRGRECDIVLDDPTVSKQHARLRIEGGRALVEDLHSTNGTLVNGKMIEGPTALRRGDRIGLGPNLIVLAGETSPPPGRERL